MKLSVVIPAYNEEGNIEILYSELLKSLTDYDYEIIFINDGSTDMTGTKIKKIADQDKKVKSIFFEKNCGQSAGFAAGFKAATGDVCVTLDADLQNDPADIPKLLSLLNEYDVVCGIRAKRNDSIIRKLSSKIANFVRKKLTKDYITDTGCSLKVFKIEVVKKFQMFNGMHRFFSALAKLDNYKVGEINVNHRQRQFGKSKYGISNRLFKSIADLFAVRWMQRRHIIYKIKETINIDLNGENKC